MEYEVQTIPKLLGLSDVADKLGWDRRKVQTYVSRGVFPEPLQRISSGPVWTEEQILNYIASRNKN